MAGGQIRVPLPLSVVLGALHKRHGGFGEVADEVFEPRGINDVVGINDSDDLRTRIGVLAQGEVQGTRLEPRPRGDVDEVHQRPVRAVQLDGIPDLRIFGVVVDYHDLEGRIVKGLERLDRLD